MAITIAELTADFRALIIDYNGHKVSIEYKPSFITPAFQDRFKKIDTKNPMELAEIVSDIVSGWDILGKDGAPMEINLDNISKFPTDFIVLVFNAIFEDLYPKKEEKKL